MLCVAAAAAVGDGFARADEEVSLAKVWQGKAPMFDTILAVSGQLRAGGLRGGGGNFGAALRCSANRRALATNGRREEEEQRGKWLDRKWL